MRAYKALYQCVLGLLFCCACFVSGTVLAQQSASFEIASEASSPWLITAKGKASFTRQPHGILIAVEALDLQLQGDDATPVMITSLKFSGQELNLQTQQRSEHGASERISVRQKVGPGQILHVEPKQAVFMPYPGWHQSNPRYYLSIEMATPHGVAFVDVPTTLSQYSFPSDVYADKDKLQHWKNDESGSVLGKLVFFAPILLIASFLLRLRQRFYGLLLTFAAVIVWTIGVFPCLRWVYAQSWSPISAHIVDVDESSHQPNGDRYHYSYQAHVKFEYEVDGSKKFGYQSDLALPQLHTSIFEAIDANQEWLNALQSGQSVQAWVNPLNHDDVVLARRVPWFAVLFALLGNLFIAWRWRRLREAGKQG